uniref:Uncharacterized protein n=1 Tax=Oryza nivara TaxID=4536 RepID=A0A0E0J6P0_ORYNI
MRRRRSSATVPFPNSNGEKSFGNGGVPAPLSPHELVVLWKLCPHAGSTPPSASSDRQMAHSTSAHLPTIRTPNAAPTAPDLSVLASSSDAGLGGCGCAHSPESRQRARQRMRHRAAAWR